MSAWGVASDLSLGRCRLYNLYHLSHRTITRGARRAPRAGCSRGDPTGDDARGGLALVGRRGRRREARKAPRALGAVSPLRAGCCRGCCGGFHHHGNAGQGCWLEPSQACAHARCRCPCCRPIRLEDCRAPRHVQKQGPFDQWQEGGACRSFALSMIFKHALDCSY